jgi:hypothetical protein
MITQHTRRVRDGPRIRVQFATTTNAPNGTSVSAIGGRKIMSLPKPVE